MGVAVQVMLNIGLAAIVAGLVAVGVSRLFPRRGNWLPVLTATFVPPLLYVTVAIYRELVRLGMAAGPDGSAGAGSRDIFIFAVQGLVFFTVIWLIVAVPASFAALHLFRRK
ncbi:MAG: hypothetical protein ABI673_09215 [Novosphingobium sp.]